MTTSISDISLRKVALIAGLGLLIMTIFAIFAMPFVFQKLIVAGDAATTANNIMSNSMLFRSGICSFLIVITCDILVAWALYVFLKPINNSLSLLAAWFRLVYSTIFAIALANYFNIFQLLGGADYLAVFEPTQLQAQVMLSINAFNDSWSIGYIFFGLHLALLGYLVFKAEYISKILGVLLMVAGLSYLVDKFGVFLFPEYDVNIATFLGWGELLFMLWLLFKGAKLTEIKENT